MIRKAVSLHLGLFFIFVFCVALVLFKGNASVTGSTICSGAIGAPYCDDRLGWVVQDYLSLVNGVCDRKTIAIARCDSKGCANAKCLGSVEETAPSQPICTEGLVGSSYCYGGFLVKDYQFISSDGSCSKKQKIVERCASICENNRCTVPCAEGYVGSKYCEGNYVAEQYRQLQNGSCDLRVIKSAYCPLGCENGQCKSVSSIITENWNPNAFDTNCKEGPVGVPYCHEAMHNVVQDYWEMIDGKCERKTQTIIYCDSNGCANGKCIQQNTEEKINATPNWNPDATGGCSNDNICAENQQCVDWKCVKLNCATCNHIENHKCIPDECCTDSACKEDQYCEPNTKTCQPILKKNDCGIIINHRWQNYECCKDSDCGSFGSCVDGHCIACADKYCCKEGTIWCSESDSCVKANDCLFKIKNSICLNQTTKGNRIIINNEMYSCNLFEVNNVGIKEIAASAVAICSNKFHTEIEIKDCAIRYIINGLERDARWMKGYYYAETCCAKNPICYENNPFNKKYLGTCQPYSGNAENIKKLSCVIPSDEIYWKSDIDLSKNSCYFSDLPVHVSMFILETGTCVDYSVALTSLLRNVGLSEREVLTVWGGGHAYNIVKLPGNSKYVIVDTVGNNGGGIIYNPRSIITWFPYCDAYQQCANDNGYQDCPSKEEILGC